MKTTDPNPSPAQRRAGNYRKRKIRWNGLVISIENPAGSLRRGRDAKGKEWSSVMPYDYGYIKGSKGADKDQVDVFIGPHSKSELVTIINQVDPKTGDFDEHKCMLQFFTKDEAVAAYKKAYDANWKGFGSAVVMPVEDFKKWVMSGRKRAELAFEDKWCRTSRPGYFYAEPRKWSGGMVRDMIRVEFAEPSGSPKLRDYRAKIDVLNLQMKQRLTQFSTRAEREQRRESIQTAMNTAGVAGSLGLGIYSIRAAAAASRTARKTGHVVDSIQRNIDPILKNASETSRNAASITRQVDRGIRKTTVNAYLARKRLRHSASPRNWTTGKLANRAVQAASRGRIRLFQHMDRRMIEFREIPKWDGKTGINPATGKFEDNRSALRKAAPYAVGGMLTTAGALAYMSKGRPKVPYARGLHPMAGTRFEPSTARTARESAVEAAAETKRKARNVTRRAAARQSLRARGSIGGIRGTSRMGARTKRVIEFNLRNPEYDNQYSGSLDPASAYRKAQTARRWANRGGQVAKDVDDIVSGRPKDPRRKRFYEQSWFKNAAVATGIGGVIWGDRQLARARRVVPALNRAGRMGRWVNSQHAQGFPVFSSRMRLINFSTYRDSDETRRVGWDVRDARGNSARVFTPDSKPRTRRAKKPYERVDNIRQQRNAALALGIVGTGLGIYGISARRRELRQLMALGRKAPPQNVVRFPKRA